MRSRVTAANSRRQRPILLLTLGRTVGRVLQRPFLWALLVASLVLPAAAQNVTPPPSDAPIAVEFPRDDGPHDSRIEWWYFTGHLESASGETFGFEYVVFHARPRGLEGYVAHFAIADDSRKAFHYDQRIVGAKGVSGNTSTLDLTLGDWTMAGAGGSFALKADMSGYDLRLELDTTKPAALHDGDGYIAYGNGTASYYYSWTRLLATGTLNTGAGQVQVRGTAWMDHQWGDFETYENGGWDWFAVQLDNGIDVMLYLIRDATGATLRVDGTIIEENGETTILRQGDFSIAQHGSWTSPTTGTKYPSGWTIAIPGHDLEMAVTPTMDNQELDTRATTGVVYWEGESRVNGTVDGKIVDGRGYVELTGYAPFAPPELPATSLTPAP